MPDSIHRVFVTGASGKLGVPLCAALLQAGYAVVALRHRDPVGVPGVDEVVGDVSDAALVEELVSRSDAVLHLATCKEDREALIPVSVQGTFNLLEAAKRTAAPKRVVLASGDAVNGIYFTPQPVPIHEGLPLTAYPGYYPLSKVLEETLFQQYYHQERVPAVCLRMSWIHADDDILNHLTVAGEAFGVPAWNDLMSVEQRAAWGEERDAAVALRHPDGRPMRRHIVAVEDCVQAFLLALHTEGIEGQTFMIAMADAFDYEDAARYASERLGIGVLDLVDPAGRDFCIDTTKARYILGYQPRYDIRALIDQAVDFQRAGRPRRRRSAYQG
ncbi:MAG: NAD(P)-dependent oxidoreductase [Vicinamibacterales bacterium]|jgi:nucleoside-diphosphate-sugar epimerase|nr:NAD(P)-dependent oxidoreductase [Vicinamibacterales bacterium]